MDANVIYRRTLRPARDAEDGETPTLLQVVYTPQLTRSYTLEFSDIAGPVVLAIDYGRERLIETAVKMDPEAAETAARAIMNIASTALLATR